MSNFSSAESSCGKRKRVVLSIESKLVMLDRLKAGATLGKLANEYRIGCSIVGDIRKKDTVVRINDGKHGSK